MNEIVSEIIKIKIEKLPPKVDYIEKQIQSKGITPLRWAIVEVLDNEIILNVSGEKIY